MSRSPATVVKDQTVPKMLPWIVSALPRPAEGDPVYPFLAPQWHLPPSPTIESLPGTDLYMASTILGSADCLNAMFVEWKPGATLRVLGWPRIPTDACSRTGVWGSLAMVLGQPAYIEYGSLDPTNLDSVVVIAPWTGKNWDPPCPVSIRFTYGYDVTLLYCGPDKTVCNAAQKASPEVERRYEAYSASFIEAFNSGILLPKFQFRGPLNAKDRALVARARRLGIPPNVTPGSDAAPEYMRNLNPGAAEYFPLPLEGKLYLGAADHKAYPNSSWPEWLFFVFEPPGANSQRLVPLAVVTAHRDTIGVKSIQAHNEGAPPDDSARVPMH